MLAFDSKALRPLIEGMQEAAMVFRITAEPLSEGMRKRIAAKMADTRMFLGFTHSDAQILRFYRMLEERTHQDMGSKEIAELVIDTYYDAMQE